MAIADGSSIALELQSCAASSHFLCAARFAAVASMFYLKASRVEDRLPPWDNVVRYLEIGDDSFAMRHVEIYENGNCLRDDRKNWIDCQRLLADMKYESLRWRNGGGSEASFRRLNLSNDRIAPK
ncbi:MAG TPA: hypothetical protein VHV08_10650 [Pirellulales bacterium]|nr:hypothetical protein [Pirellulales bacterium]